MQEFRTNMKIGSLIQVKFDARGRVSKKQGSLGLFMQNLPADSQFFNVLVGNFDAEKCTTPITLFALLNQVVASAAESTSTQPLAADADEPHLPEREQRSSEGATSEDHEERFCRWRRSRGLGRIRKN